MSASIKAKVPYFTLNNGCKIPGFGLGTYKGHNLEEVVKKGIDIGYRLIDTAFIYENEDAIGKALKAVLEEKKVPREELFIVSKLWNTRHKPEDVLPAIKRTLKDLQLDYLDLYLMHWPFAQTQGENEYVVFESVLDDSLSFEDTWLAMEELVKVGLTKSIGLSNFNSQQVDRILKIATIKPVVNQVECNPYLSQEKLREFCKQRDIVIMAYSPLYAPGGIHSENHGLNLFEEPIIKELAEKYKKSAAQIIFKYLAQCGTVPIPKTDKTDRLKSNFDIWDFTIAPEDFEKMRSLNKNQRCVTFSLAEKAKEYPFSIEF